ncbi:MAG: DUF4231 domain-containing protein [Saprospiraceae bacterium]|nr:DUF4231 domain-containing protein [Saprospiraceae bacterium]
MEEKVERKFSSHRDVQAYFDERIKNKINIYEKLAKKHKSYYLSSSSISIIFSTLIPILINLKYDKVDTTLVATILSLIVAITVGLQELFQPKEHWRNYDKISATLRREEMLFSTNSGIYSEVDSNDKFNLFVSRIEDFISREREETITMRTDENNINLNDKGQITISNE